MFSLLKSLAFNDRGNPIATLTIAAARASRSAKRHGANAAARGAIATIQRDGLRP